MDARLIKALTELNKTLTEFLKENEETEVIDVPVVEEEKSNVVPMTRKEKEQEVPLPTLFTKEDLDEMSYNRLKTLAKECGLSGAGSREEIIERLTPDKAEEIEPDKEEKPAKTVRRVGKKAVEEEPKEEPKEEPEEVEEEEGEDSVETSVKLAVVDMSDEQIMDILTEVGVKARGKRQALISAVIKAVREGKIELDAEETDEDETTPEEEVEVTPEREKAIQEYIKAVNKRVKSGDLTKKEMVDWLNSYYHTKEFTMKMDTKTITEKHLQTNIDNYINDEGELVEELEVPYTVNGVPYCCGSPLEEREDSYHCQYCDNDYSTEDEE